MTTGENTIILYDVNDIRRIFKCGKRQAYALMNASTFPSFKINSRSYISKEKLLDWLEKSGKKEVCI